MRTTAEVFRDHRTAIATGELDAILANYGPAAVLIRPGQVAHGQAEIRAAFESVFGGLDGFDVAEDSVTFDGPFVLFEWSGAHPDGRRVSGVDTFHIETGLTRHQTLSYAIAPA